VPFRNSILNDWKCARVWKLPQEWLQSVMIRHRSAKLGLRVSFRSPNSRPRRAGGRDGCRRRPSTELKKAHEQFRPILERSEKS